MPGRHLAQGGKHTRVTEPPGETSTSSVHPGQYVDGDGDLITSGSPSTTLATRSSRSPWPVYTRHNGLATGFRVNSSVASPPGVTNLHARLPAMLGGMRPRWRVEKRRGSYAASDFVGCFRCGDIGHWVANCPVADGGVGLPPSDWPTCDVPTHLARNEPRLASHGASPRERTFLAWDELSPCTPASGTAPTEGAFREWDELSPCTPAECADNDRAAGCSVTAVQPLSRRLHVAASSLLAERPDVPLSPPERPTTTTAWVADAGASKCVRCFGIGRCRFTPIPAGPTTVHIKPVCEPCWRAMFPAAAPGHDSRHYACSDDSPQSAGSPCSTDGDGSLQDDHRNAFRFLDKMQRAASHGLARLQPSCPSGDISNPLRCDEGNEICAATVPDSLHGASCTQTQDDADYDLGADVHAPARIQGAGRDTQTPSDRWVDAVCRQTKRRVLENQGKGECFYLACQQAVPLAIRAAVSPAVLRARGSEWLRAQCSSHRTGVADVMVVAGACATEQHVDAVAQALPGVFPDGLLVVHMQASAGVLFRHEEQPLLLTIADTVSAARGNIALPTLLYTEPDDECGPGHFVALIPHAASGQAPLAIDRRHRAPLPATSTTDMHGGMETPYHGGGWAATRSHLRSLGFTDQSAVEAAAAHPYNLQRAIDHARHSPASPPRARQRLGHGPHSPGASTSAAIQLPRHASAPAGRALIWTPPPIHDHTLPTSHMVVSLDHQSLADRHYTGPLGRPLGLRPPTSWSTQDVDDMLIDERDAAEENRRLEGPQPPSDEDLLHVSPPWMEWSPREIDRLLLEEDELHRREEMQPPPDVDPPSDIDDVVNPVLSPRSTLFPRVSERQRELLRQFWDGRRAAVEDAAERIYRLHTEADMPNQHALLQHFLDLPIDWPVQASQFGLTHEDVMRGELDLWDTRVTASMRDAHTIVDACNTPLDAVRLCPFFVAVIMRFATDTGIAPELPFGFLYTTANWVCHKHLHGCFNPRKPEHEVRSRSFPYIIASSNIGKTPFWADCVQPIFDGGPTRAAITATHAQCFVDGGKKGLYMDSATQADIANRMGESGGRVYWASDEGVLVLDTQFAQGKSKPDKEKVNFHFLLSTQNGFSYRGTSAQSSGQRHACSTNFGFFHAGQPKAIHNYWGHVFTPSSPIQGQGYEFRPTFLWAQRQSEDNPQRPHVSFLGAGLCLRLILLTLAANVGQTQDQRSFHSQPIVLSPESQELWNHFKNAAEQSRHAAPAYARDGIGKYGFTTAGHVLTTHLLCERC